MNFRNSLGLGIRQWNWFFFGRRILRFVRDKGEQLYAQTYSYGNYHDINGIRYFPICFFFYAGSHRYTTGDIAYNSYISHVCFAAKGLSNFFDVFRMYALTSRYSCRVTYAHFRRYFNCFLGVVVYVVCP